MKRIKALAISILAVFALTMQNTAQEGTRQIHLDFHTSEHIPDIGAKFSKKQFQEALIEGNVNAINIFAKGHHSWSYYPTEVGMMHPNLDFDLMGAQIEACREIGVKVNLYFTVGWSATDAINHPEWARLDKNGTNPYREMKKKLGPNETFGGWEYLAPEGPYAKLIYAQTEELLKNYDFDGFWYDIHSPELLNYNEWARKDMLALGIDINDEEAVIKRQNEKYYEFFQTTRDLIAKYKPNATVYYNGTTRTYNDENVELFKYGFDEYNTKHDLEDLPTAWGGYDIFPWRSKYFANTGKEIVAMSGKFHKAWGEFGGFKHPDAILYEAASMISFGANVNFGDQLHPSGEMDMSTYKNIGIAFDYVQKIEDYGVGGISKARTGLYIGEDLSAIEGTAEMLLEHQVNFNVVNTLENWSDIEVLVITSDGVLKKDVQRVQNFVNLGGKVLAMGKGIFVDGKPIIDIGAEYLGEANYDIDYTVVNDAVSNEMVETPFLNYTAALRVKPKPGTEVLARIREPYFSRTIEHYSSHKNTPYRLEDAEHPAVIRNGNIVYIAHDLDNQYKKEGARLHRDLFYNALQLLLTKPFVTAEMQSMGRVNLLHQPNENRYVYHMLYASPIQRGNVRVVEDLVPLFDVPVTVDFEEEIKNVHFIPSGKKAEFKKEGDKLKVVVPELYIHEAIVFEHE